MSEALCSLVQSKKYCVTGRRGTERMQVFCVAELGIILCLCQCQMVIVKQTLPLIQSTITISKE